MKTLLLIFAFGAGLLHGEPAVRVLRAGGHDVLPPFDVWGGQPVELALEIASDPGHTLGVRADVFQVASAIAAPVSRDLPVARELDFCQASARVEQWSWSPPAVRRVSFIELRFASQVDSATEWRVAGTVRVVVYPADFGAQIKDFVVAAQERDGGRLGIFGESPNLKAALHDLSVPFIELGETLPDELDAATIYLGECGANELEALAKRELRGRVALFVDDPGALPGLYWNDRPGGYQVKVTFPLFPGLADEPRRLATFFRLLQRIYSPRTSPTIP